MHSNKNASKQSDKDQAGLVNVLIQLSGRRKATIRSFPNTTEANPATTPRPCHEDCWCNAAPLEVFKKREALAIMIAARGFFDGWCAGLNCLGRFLGLGKEMWDELNMVGKEE